MHSGVGDVRGCPRALEDDVHTVEHGVINIQFSGLHVHRSDVGDRLAESHDAVGNLREAGVSIMVADGPHLRCAADDDVCALGVERLVDVHPPAIEHGEPDPHGVGFGAEEGGVAMHAALTSIPTALEVMPVADHQALGALVGHVVLYQEVRLEHDQGVVGAGVPRLVVGLEDQQRVAREGDLRGVDGLQAVVVVDPQDAAVHDVDPGVGVVGGVVVQPQRGVLPDLDDAEEVVVVVVARPDVREGDRRPGRDGAAFLEVHPLAVLVVQALVEVDVDPGDCGAEGVLPDPDSAADDLDLGVSAGRIKGRVSVAHFAVLEDVDVSGDILGTRSGRRIVDRSAGQRAVVLAAVGEVRTDVHALEARVAQALDDLTGRYALGGTLDIQEELGRAAHVRQRRVVPGDRRVHDGVVLEGHHAGARRVVVNQVRRVAGQHAHGLDEHLGRLVDGRIQLDSPVGLDDQRRFADQARAAQGVAVLDDDGAAGDQDVARGIQRAAAVEVQRAGDIGVGGGHGRAVDVHRAEDAKRSVVRTHRAPLATVSNRVGRVDAVFAAAGRGDPPVVALPASPLTRHGDEGVRHVGGEELGVVVLVVVGAHLLAGVKDAVVVHVDEHPLPVIVCLAEPVVARLRRDEHAAEGRDEPFGIAVERGEGVPRADFAGCQPAVLCARGPGQDRSGLVAGHRPVRLVNVGRTGHVHVRVVVGRNVEEDRLADLTKHNCLQVQTRAEGGQVGVEVHRRSTAAAEVIRVGDRRVDRHRAALDHRRAGVGVGEAGVEVDVAVDQHGAGVADGVGHRKAHGAAGDLVRIGHQGVAGAQGGSAAGLPVGAHRQRVAHAAEVERTVVEDETRQSHVAADRQRAAGVQLEVAVDRHAAGDGGRACVDVD